MVTSPNQKLEYQRSSAMNMFQTNMSGMYFASERKSHYGDLGYDQRNMFDGTSEREINKALSTFMNVTGPGDYHLPHLTGSGLSTSKMRNAPQWSMKRKSKPSWFPNMAVDFVGKSSPRSTLYSPKPDKAYPTLQYSSPKF